MKIYINLCLLLVAGLMSSCNDLGDPVQPQSTSFSQSIQPLISSRCAVFACHGGGSSEGGLSFGAATYDSIRFAAGTHGPVIDTSVSASNNTLYRVTTQSPPSGIQRMPYGGPFLSTQEQELIKDWIDEGALNN